MYKDHGCLLFHVTCSNCWYNYVGVGATCPGCIRVNYSWPSVSYLYVRFGRLD